MSTTEQPKPLTEAEHRLLQSLTVTGWLRLQTDKESRKAQTTNKPRR